VIFAIRTPNKGISGEREREKEKKRKKKKKYFDSGAI